VLLRTLFCALWREHTFSMAFATARRLASNDGRDQLSASTGNGPELACCNRLRHEYSFELSTETRIASKITSNWLTAPPRCSVTDTYPERSSLPLRLLYWPRLLLAVGLRCSNLRVWRMTC
jgi:hypothetical protein